MGKSDFFFDRTSKLSRKKLSQSAIKTIQFTIEHINSNFIVLDFGCGSGTITNEIAKHVKSINAIDISQGMIEVAKKYAKEDTIENVNYLQSSLFDERFKENSFDVILAFNIFHYIEDISEVIQRTKSLLKPNGLLISSTACLKEKKNFIRVLMFFLSKLKIIPKTFFYKVSELEMRIKQEGFEIEETKLISGLPEYFIVAKK